MSAAFKKIAFTTLIATLFTACGGGDDDTSVSGSLANSGTPVVDKKPVADKTPVADKPPVKDKTPSDQNTPKPSNPQRIPFAVTQTIEDPGKESIGDVSPDSYIGSDWVSTYEFKARFFTSQKSIIDYQKFYFYTYDTPSGESSFLKINESESILSLAGSGTTASLNYDVDGDNGTITVIPDQEYSFFMCAPGNTESGRILLTSSAAITEVPVDTLIDDIKEGEYAIVDCDASTGKFKISYTLEFSADGTTFKFNSFDAKTNTKTTIKNLNTADAFATAGFEIDNKKIYMKAYNPSGLPTSRPIFIIDREGDDGFSIATVNI